MIKTERSAPRKRLKIQMAGSVFSRGTRKLPQTAPKNEVIAPVAPIIELLPSCPHGKQLTSKEYQSQVPDGQIPLVQLDNGSIIQRSLHSWDCLWCHPYCIHGQELTDEDITLGVKQCSKCKVCFPPLFSTSIAAWDESLSKAGFSKYRGMSMVEEVRTLTDGSVKISGYSKNLCTGGGSKSMEDADTKAEFGGESGIGHGSGTDHDESNWVDDLNEPVSSKSDFIAKCESIKSETISNHIADQLIDAETETEHHKKELVPELKPEATEVEQEQDGIGYNEFLGMKQIKLSKTDKKAFEDIKTTLGEKERKETPEEAEGWLEEFLKNRNAGKTDGAL
jgi:hypothetical protein